jgi:FMN-dependent NADH-azoreductase
MNTLLYIQSSIHSDAGASSALARTFVDQWRADHPNGRVIERDLARDPVPHLDAERFGAFIAPAEARTTAQQAIVDASDRLIEELRHADTLVLGLPLYNFGVPSTLKAYFDHVARAGVTFRYTQTGSVGLLSGKEAYVFATRGGIYHGADVQPQYVRNFLNFLGIEPVRFVFAEGLALGEASKQQSLAQARLAIAGLSSPAERRAA